MICLFSLKSLHFFFLHFRGKISYSNLFFFYFNQRIRPVGVANSHFRDQGPVPTCLVTSSLGLQAVQVLLIQTKKSTNLPSPQITTPLFFFFYFIANISLLCWSLHFFPFYIHLSSLKYCVHVYRVPKTTLIKVTGGLFSITYNDVVVCDFSIDYFFPP